MKITKKKKLSIKKVILIIIAILAALFVLISLFAGNYLVNYSIGRSGDGGNRTVALEIPETADDTERTIAEGKIAQQEANEAFLAENPGQTVEITTEDDIHCNGVYYPNGESHDWVIALHGYRGDHLGATSLAQHYYTRNYQVLTPDLRACGDNPHAVDAAGENVTRIRLIAVLVSGALSGLAGISFAYSISANFSSNIYVGYGYLAIAAMIFGNWKSLPTLGSCLLFGFARSGGYYLVQKMQMPSSYSDLAMTLPYIVTMLLLIFFSKYNRAPRALGEIYDKGKR